MNSLHALSRVFLLFLLFIVLFSPIASSVEIHSPLDPYEKYYRNFYHDNSYIVYRGMVLNIVIL